MYRLFLTLALIIFAPLAAATSSSTHEDSKTHDSNKIGYKEINTEELKEMIDSKKTMVLLDARKKLKGGLIPGAKNLPYNADDKEVAHSLGSLSKDAIIVVYCANLYCPLSKYLAEKLFSMGYTNVYKYPDGVAGWLDKDYPLDPIKES